MYRRQAHRIGQIRLPQRHRATMIGGEADRVLPQVEFAEQMRDLSLG
ncbi:hypothetical protein [Methylorubrum extorquens]|uniref:Uncharacterized protein n=1 Tax=Methylorubrum extorquens TaxID=408 RepID=A0AAX3WIY5_METEX|nr:MULTISPECIES: hypothetical protein [Methylobacteriaceae]WHQ70383.1 hypothetical protein KEC54_01660 [Methylorubrum extorquens]